MADSSSLVMGAITTNGRGRVARLMVVVSVVITAACSPGGSPDVETVAPTSSVTRELGGQERPILSVDVDDHTDTGGSNQATSADPDLDSDSESSDTTQSDVRADAGSGGDDASRSGIETGDSAATTGPTGSGGTSTTADSAGDAGDDGGLYCTANGLNRMLRPDERPPACWRPYGWSSPFNRPLPAEPKLHPRSDRIVDRTLSLGPIVDSVSAPDNSSDWYHPIYFSTADDPVYVIECTNPDWGRCEIEGMKVHIPSRARPAGGGDAHLSVIEQHTGWEYDLWKVSDKPAGGGVLRTEWGGRTRIDGQGLKSDATAAHFGLAAGVVRPEELAAGEINHALFLLVGCVAEEPVPPATGRGSTCSDPTDAPSIGQLFWLDMTDAEIAALDIALWKKALLKAMATYGGYVGDTGGNEAFAISFESPSSFTSFGFFDPWRMFLGQGDVSESGGKIYFDIASAVDWAGRLRVVDVCHAAGTC